MTTRQPGSEPVDTEDDGENFKEIAILCEPCYESGCWDTMRPGGNHDNEHVWGVADVGADDDFEWHVTWLVTGLTVAEAEAHLDEMEFPGGWHRMS